MTGCVTSSPAALEGTTEGLVVVVVVVIMVVGGDEAVDHQ